MTKLEELLNTYTAAYAAWDAADAARGASEAADAADYVDADAWVAAWVAAYDAWIAYQAELKKTQKEQTND